MASRAGYVREIMDAFASETGLTTAVRPRRYLWTDAFAVCVYLSLHRRGGSNDDLGLAIRLVDRVHALLGRHRDDDARSGWISGLSEEEGARHPTAGGLRIGKLLPERGPGAPVDARLEWERDGQYFHYLTKWMVALQRLAEATAERRYGRWAVELARAACQAFIYEAARGRKRMYWKMSIDLSRPLVDSMGQHDPLDGLVTLSTLRAGEGSAGEAAVPDLDAEIDALASMCCGARWATDDPLGAGGLLLNACAVARLGTDLPTGRGEILPRVLDDARRSVEAVAGSHLFGLPAHRRLAFRELGLSLGLAAVDSLRARAPRSGGDAPSGVDVAAWLRGLERHLPLRERIERFWLDPASQAAETWTGHLDINRVMLAASLAPEGYLGV